MFSDKNINLDKQKSKASIIFESKDIKDILPYCATDAVAVFDFDYTICRGPGFLGSPPWFKQFVMVASSKFEYEHAKLKTIQLQRDLQYHLNIEIVNEDVKIVVDKLDERQVPKLLLTARGDEAVEVTEKQLKKLNVDFAKNWPAEEFYFPVDGGKHTAYYKNGCIYCDGYDKGKCLIAFYLAKKLPLPSLIAMADDEGPNLSRARKQVEKRGSRFVGLRYSTMDDIVKNYNHEIADKELIALHKKLSFESREYINILFTDNLSKFVPSSLNVHSMFSKCRRQSEKSEKAFVEMQVDSFVVSY